METEDSNSTKSDEDDGDFSDDDDDDPDIPRCGVTLAQLKTRIKEEIVENGMENYLKCVEEHGDHNGIKVENDSPLNPVNGDVYEEDKNELEFKVAHFLAETSVSRRKHKKSNGNSIKSACKFKCNECSALFRYKSTLTYHMKSECGTGVITAGSKVVRNSPALCNICNKQLSSRTSLMVHLRIHTGERPFGCSECGQSFSQNAHLKDHVARLHSANPDQLFLCRLCNTTFGDRATLRSHMDDHVGQQRPFQCQHCRKRYQTKDRLESHVCTFKHTTNDTDSVDSATQPTSPQQNKKGLTCSACGFVATSRSQLRDHLASHPLPVACPECSENFDSLSAWRKHNRRNHRSKLSKCSYCSRTFPSEYDVRVHERSHTGERPYQCTFCGRGFARKSILDVHTTLHTGRRDYVCSECGSAFNRKSKLDVHRAEHTDAHVQCETCQKTFKCKAYLMTHLKTHVRDSTATCATCGRQFSSRRGLRSHINKGCSPWSATGSSSSTVARRPIPPSPPPLIPLFPHRALVGGAGYLPIKSQFS